MNPLNNPNSRAMQHKEARKATMKERNEARALTCCAAPDDSMHERLMYYYDHDTRSVAVHRDGRSVAVITHAHCDRYEEGPPVVVFCDGRVFEDWDATLFLTWQSAGSSSDWGKAPAGWIEYTNLDLPRDWHRHGCYARCRSLRYWYSWFAKEQA